MANEFDCQRTENRLKLSGVISETADLSPLVLALAEAQNWANQSLGKDLGSQAPRIILDFDHVLRANSHGLQQFLRIAQKATSRLVYQNCPFWLTSQFNFLAEFFAQDLFPGGVTVESFRLPYYSKVDGKTVERTVTVGIDIPLLPSYENFEAPEIMSDGRTYTPAFDPESSLCFLSEWIFLQRKAHFDATLPQAAVHRRLSVFCSLSEGSNLSREAIATAFQTRGIPFFFSHSVSELHQDLSLLPPGHRSIVVADAPMLSLLHQEFGKSEDLTVLILESKLARVNKLLRNHIFADMLLTIDDPQNLDLGDLWSSLQHMAGGDIFGLDDHLPLRNSSECQFLIRENTDKDDAITRINQWLTAQSAAHGVADGLESFVVSLSIILDELILNGVFHANLRYTPLRGVAGNFNLSAHEQIELTCRFDGRTLGISVRDPFGIFGRDTLSNYIIQERGKPGETGDKKKSLGVGLRWTFDRVDKLIVNVSPGKSTEVICLFELPPSPVKRKLKSKSFQFRDSSLLKETTEVDHQEEKAPRGA